MKIRAKKRLILMTITQQGKNLTDYHKFYIMCTFICTYTLGLGEYEDIITLNECSQKQLFRSLF